MNLLNLPQASNIAGLVRGMSSNTLNTPNKNGKTGQSIPRSQQPSSRGPSEQRNSVYSEHLVSEKIHEDSDEETTSFGFRPTRPTNKDTHKKSGRIVRTWMYLI